MRATILCVVLFGVFGSIGICQTPSKQLEWKEYVYPSEGFAITLPSDPKPHDDPINPGYIIYTVHLSPTLVVTFRDTKKQDCVTILNEARDVARRGTEPTIVNGSFKEVTVQGHPGQEWQLAVPAVGCTVQSTGLCRRKVLYLRVPLAGRKGDATVCEANSKFHSILERGPLTGQGLLGR